MTRVMGIYIITWMCFSIACIDYDTLLLLNWLEGITSNIFTVISAVAQCFFFRSLKVHKHNMHNYILYHFGSFNVTSYDFHHICLLQNRSSIHWKIQVLYKAINTIIGKIQCISIYMSNIQYEIFWLDLKKIHNHLMIFLNIIVYRKKKSYPVFLDFQMGHHVATNLVVEYMTKNSSL